MMLIEDLKEDINISLKDIQENISQKLESLQKETQKSLKETGEYVLTDRKSHSGNKQTNKQKNLKEMQENIGSTDRSPDREHTKIPKRIIGKHKQTSKKH